METFRPRYFRLHSNNFRGLYFQLRLIRPRKNSMNRFSWIIEYICLKGKLELTRNQVRFSKSQTSSPIWCDFSRKEFENFTPNFTLISKSTWSHSNEITFFSFSFFVLLSSSNHWIGAPDTAMSNITIDCWCKWTENVFVALNCSQIHVISNILSRTRANFKSSRLARRKDLVWMTKNFHSYRFFHPPQPRNFHDAPMLNENIRVSRAFAVFGVKIR